MSTSYIMAKNVMLRQVNAEVDFIVGMGIKTFCPQSIGCAKADPYRTCIVTAQPRVPVRVRFSALNHRVPTAYYDALLHI